MRFIEIRLSLPALRSKNDACPKDIVGHPVHGVGTVTDVGNAVSVHFWDEDDPREVAFGDLGLIRSS
jgi:hypothetical protein